MVLKTRKAMCKLQLFRKFKIIFFNLFSKSSRVSRRIFNFVSRRGRRYKFWHTKQLRRRQFRRLIVGGAYKLLIRFRSLIVKRFSFFQTTRNRFNISRYFVKRLIKCVAISNGIRSRLLEQVDKLDIVSVSHKVMTPVDRRFAFIYNFKR